MRINLESKLLTIKQIRWIKTGPLCSLVRTYFNSIILQLNNVIISHV